MLFPLALPLALFLSSPAHAAAPSAPERPKMVVIDAGHTLRARGALAAIDARPELEFNQRMAVLLAEELAKRGVSTRFANTPARRSEDFKARADASRGADFFISVHHDSAEAAWLTRLPAAAGLPERYEDRANRFSGFSLFLSRRGPGIETSSRCASAAGAALIQAGERPSLYHGDPRFGAERAYADKARGSHYFDGLAVLRQASSPSFLWEVGVIVNPSESMRLRQDPVARRMASAVAGALAECLSHPLASAS